MIGYTEVFGYTRGEEKAPVMASEKTLHYPPPYYTYLYTPPSLTSINTWWREIWLINSSITFNLRPNS